MPCIKCKLAQSVVLLLLKPEWLAKTERHIIMQQSAKYIKIVSNYIDQIFKASKKYHKIYNLQFILNCKNTMAKDVIKKIDSSQTISKKLYYWFARQDIVPHNTSSIYFIKRASFCNELYNCLQFIYLIGIEWCLYTNLKNLDLYLNLYLINTIKEVILLSRTLYIQTFVKCINKFLCNKAINLKTTKCNTLTCYYKHINLLDIKIKKQQSLENITAISKTSIKNILYQIRYIFYCKNQIGYWRINSQLNKHKALLLTQDLLQFWYLYYFILIKAEDIKSINKKVDQLIYLWQRKQQK